jgi:hypothetical protein
MKKDIVKILLDKEKERKITSIYLSLIPKEFELSKQKREGKAILGNIALTILIHQAENL